MAGLLLITAITVPLNPVSAGAHAASPEGGSGGGQPVAIEISDPELLEVLAQRTSMRTQTVPTVVVEVLAEALAETGEAEHGLKFLERLHQGSQDPQARAALTARIRDFRGRNKLGQIWEFADAYGDVLFESADMAEILKALKSGTVPKNAKCRRDRIGEWQPVETTLGPLSPDIAALYAPGTSAASWVFPALVMILVAVIVAAIVLL